MKTIKYLPLMLIFVLVLTTCQSIGSVIQEPKVSLNSVDIAKISLSGVDLIAHIDVDNPNGFSVPLPKVDWELFINTASFIQGSLKKDQSIKSRGKATLDLPFSVTYSGLYNSFKSLIETKEAAYEIAMGLSFPIPLLESKVYKLDFSGVIPLPQLPNLSPGEIKISRIDFNGIELACGINVDNPNLFPIPFPEIEWNYDVNGVPLLKSSLASAGEIAAGAAGAALVSVSVAYTDVLKAVGSLANQGEAKTNLSLETGFPVPLPDGTAITDGLKSMLEIPGTLPILQKPEISFKGIERKSIGTTMEFALNWEIINKNSFDFGIDEFRYDFKVNSNAWAQGIMNNPPRVKASGSTIIPLNVSISALSMVMELVDIINKGTQVNYDCSGNMILSGSIPGLDKLELPLDLKGSTKIQ